MMTAPIRDVPHHGELIGTVRTLDDAVDVFRAMRERLGLTNQFLEDCYGFAKGHPDKVLGRSEQKKLGYDSFRLFCEVFAVEFRVYIDPAQLKRMEAIWEERERPLYKPEAKPGRISKKIMAAATPIILQQRARLGGMARAHLLTSKQRSEIASKAAKAKHRKSRQRKRAIARSKPCATKSPSEPSELDRRLSPSKHTICVSSAG